MQGIDISSWQTGINLGKVPCDFAIMKATEGTGYTNPDCVRAVEQCIGLGKPFGVYHYVNGGSGAVAEADFFVDSVSNWVRKGLLIIDWEAKGNTAWGNTSYLDSLVKRVIARTGIKPLIYASATVYPWDVAKSNDCGAWVAQYGSMDPTGYQDAPWNEGAYSCAMRQYASNGRLEGWNAGLDLNKFYGDATAWAAYAGGSAVPSVTAPSDPFANMTDQQLADAVIRGEFGDGDARRNALGARYSAVQEVVNAKVYAAKPTTAGSAKYTVQSGDTLSYIATRFGVPISAITGYRSGNPNVIYQGETLTIGSTTTQSAETVYTVQHGDTLSAIASKYGTTYQALAAKNGISNPNLIHPGQKIRI